MSPDGTSSAPGLRLVRLHVENYRVLKDVTFEALTPYTVLFGPNGSGKSTALDVLEFVAEAFATNLTAAWDRRGGAAGLMTRGSKGPLVIEIDAEASGTGHLLTYRLELTQDDRGPVVERETVRLRTSSHDDASRTLLELRRGEGTAVSAGAVGTATDDVSVSLSAVNAIGLATAALIVVSRSGAAPAPAESPHLLTLSRFILGWRFTEAARVRPRTPAVTVSHPSLPSKTLETDAGNLPQVIAHLQEHDPGRLRRICEAMRAAIPGFGDVRAVAGAGGRWELDFSDRTFQATYPEVLASDGSVHLLALLTRLYGSDEQTLIGVEEPESQIHPRLHYLVSEALREATQTASVLVTTHSPQLVDELRPEELWLLHRGEDGFTRVQRALDQERVMAMYRAGGHLGDLWMEGFFDAGDPTVQGGRP